MAVKGFGLNTMIFSLFAIFTFRGQETLPNLGLECNNEDYNNCLLGGSLDQSLDFVQILYSRKNLKSEINFLEELENLQEEFSDCKSPRKKLVIANKAIGVLKRLAKSEEILKDRKLCAKFEVFLISMLILFGFDQNAIEKFVYQLNLNSKLRWGCLKIKGGCRVGTRSLVYLLIFVVAVNKVFKLAYNVYQLRTDPEKAISFSEFFKVPVARRWIYSLLENFRNLMVFRFTGS